MDNQVHNSIVSFIWGIADDCLRDVYVRGKYRDVILPMTVIRRLEFTVDTFTHLKHGGRVSGAAAAMGTALQIKPLLHVDSEGKLQAVEKPRGRKKAVTTQIARMEQGWKPELGKSILIGHADDPEAADMLKERLLEQFPDSEICIAYIGPIIGAHTGPGALALIYWGNNR